MDEYASPLYGELRKHLGEVFRKLAQQKESRIEEGHLMPDHVHMMISIPPKYAGGRFYQGQECHPFGPCVWREEAQLCRAALLGKRLFRLDRRSRRSRVREYIKNQEQEDDRLDQMNLWR